jgi:predicted PurR-regulated permease PerM
MDLDIVGKGVTAMKKRIRQILKGREGSSLVSVMAAFVILMIGIAGFYSSIQVARSMIARAQNLNEATGEALEKFYSEAPISGYSTAESWFVMNAKEVQEDGSTGSTAFSLNGDEKEITVTATSSDNEEINFTFYYYLPMAETK